jgi:hypothetical protein
MNERNEGVCLESDAESQERNYRERLDRIEKYADDIYKSFLEKALWKCLSERRFKQKNFRAYCQNYGAFCEQAASDGGVFDRYCRKHRNEPVRPGEVEAFVKNAIMRGVWCGGLTIPDLDLSRREEFANAPEPKPLESYSNLLGELADLDDGSITDIVDEVCSLAYFEGNREEIVTRIGTWKGLKQLEAELSG